ncbi:MAG TPA: restriction endonuclease [Candidatus Paceibacterota bacterium]|nr:restriction endonuclease [Candidatus Paceibacterota bacterium]
MASKYRNNEEPLVTRIMAYCLVLYALLFIGALNSGPNGIVVWLIYGVVIFGTWMGVKLAYWYWTDRAFYKHLDDLLVKINEKGLREYINNFINRFSIQSSKKSSWSFRGHNIDWDRIKDLEDYLLEQGIPLRNSDKEKDIYILLRHYIQTKEEAVTRESIKLAPQNYSMLSGTEFEKLLYRLFEAMGYRVEHIGHSGDQGGDLIANKDGERILIQAKCYRDWSVGNAAVQQVVGAIKYYDCNKSMVVSTSENFTNEAIALAQANNTELVSRARLSELLLQYLHENWG